MARARPAINAIGGMINDRNRSMIPPVTLFLVIPITAITSDAKIRGPAMIDPINGPSSGMDRLAIARHIQPGLSENTGSSWVCSIGLVLVVGERIGHPRRGGNPEFIQERYPPFDGATGSSLGFAVAKEISQAPARWHRSMTLTTS